MAENIIRVVFEDNSSSDIQENTSPLNDTTTPAESILSSFTTKLQQTVELLIKNLNSQTKPNPANLQQSATQNPTFDSQTMKDFNGIFKDITQDGAATIKQFKEVNKSLLEFNKQLKNIKAPTDNNDNSKDKSTKNSRITAAIAKTGIAILSGGLPLYYATEAFRNYAATNALDYGNNLMNPLAYASQRRGLQYEQDKSIAGGIGAVVGAALGSVVPGVGTALGIGLGATAGSQIGSLGYSYFGGQDNAQDQLQYEVSQNYTNLKRGNALSQQLASMYGSTFNSSPNAPPENMFLLPQFLQMAGMNQFGGNLAQSDLAGVAKISDRYNANPTQVGSLLTQINASIKDMSTTLLNVDSHAQKTGGDIVSQLAVAVQLMQKGGLSAPDAINKAFNQSLYGVTYAGAQNNYFQSSYINQYRMRTLGKIAGINVEGILQNEPKAIAKFNRLQTRAINNRLTPDANTLLINMVAQNLGLGNGTINTNAVNQGTVTPYNDIFKNLSNPETIQHKNYKNLSIKPEQDLYNEITPHEAFKTSIADKLVDKGKQSLTHVLAGQYVDNLRRMETDKKSGNMADYQHLERLNKNLEQQIKALNKNTQALQHIRGSY